MESNTDFNQTEFECAGSNKQTHFINNPTLLQCGHFMCFDCAESEKNADQTVRCRICGEDKLINMKTNPASLLMDKQIKMNLDKLFDVVKQQCDFSLRQFEKSFIDKKESLELQFQYIKEDIEIRAESLKIEIDKLCETIYRDMRVHKDQKLKEIDDNNVSASKYKKNLEILTDLTLIEKTKENLAKFQNTLNSFDVFMKEDENYTKLVELIPAYRKVDLEFLTCVNYGKDENKNVVLPHQFKQKISINERKFYFGDLCMLTEYRLLATHYINECLSLYDENMNLIEKFKIEIPSSEKSQFYPFGITTNGQDRIFISDLKNGILMTDFNFNLLKFIELKHLRGLCYSNGLVYVCESDKKCIFTFQPELTYVASFQLDFEPWYIQVIDNIACIRHCHEKCISFFQLPDFTLKYRYYGHNGFICTVGSKFYEFYQPKSKFYCYNNDGTICYVKNIRLPVNKKISSFDPICYFGERFVLVSSICKNFFIHIAANK